MTMCTVAIFAVGYPCFKVSAKSGTGVAEIKKALEGKITLFSGHSGVGKSTLINSILPGIAAKTGEISSYHNKGMHTTTFSEMFPLENKVILPSSAFLISATPVPLFAETLKQG